MKHSYMDMAEAMMEHGGWFSQGDMIRRWGLTSDQARTRRASIRNAAHITTEERGHSKNRLLKVVAIKECPHARRNTVANTRKILARGVRQYWQTTTELAIATGLSGAVVVKHATWLEEHHGAEVDRTRTPWMLRTNKPELSPWWLLTTKPFTAAAFAALNH